MRKKCRVLRLVVPTLLVVAFGVGARAEIKSFTLDEMVQTADQAIYGQIIASRVTRLDSPTEGSDLYYTTISIQGRTLADERSTTVDVTFRGGFLDATRGVFNSEAPAADDVKIGKRVVAFYRWADDMGGGMPANALVAAHGGIYRTVQGPNGPAVLGRGEGYAIGSNRSLEQLESAVRALAAKKPLKR